MSFRQYLRRLRQYAHPGRPAPRTRDRRRPPQVETLEDRTLLSVSGTFLGPIGLQVGANFNVSKAPQSQSEELIAIDPRKPGNMIAAPNDFNGLQAGTDNVWVTTNAGVTWNEVSVPIPAGAAFSAGDPDILFDNTGRAIFAHLIVGPGGNTSIGVATSADGGLTWTAGQVDPFDSGDDKEIMAIGPAPSNPGQQRLYIGFQRSGVQYVSSSADGLNWAIPVRATDPQGQCQELVPPFSSTNCGINAHPAVAPNGDVYLIWEDFGTDTTGLHDYITFDKSTDGGVHWSTPVKLVTTNINDFNDPALQCTIPWKHYCIPAQPDRGLTDGLNLDVDRTGGPHNGRLYLSFVNAPLTHDDTNIYLMYSDDGGATWSTPKEVNDDKGNNSQFNDTMSVDQTTGTVGIGWYDARNSASNDEVQFYGTISTDGGQTFLPNVQLSTGSSNGADMGTGFSFGEYAGFGFLGGSIYPLWTDNSNSTGDNPNGGDNGGNIYTAPIEMKSSGGEAITVTGDTPDANGNHQWYIQVDPSGHYLQFWENNPNLLGVPTYTATLAAVGSINIQGLSGSNTVTLDFTYGNPVPAGGLTFDGGTTAGANNLLVLRGGTYVNEKNTLAGGSGTITLDNGGATLANVSFSHVGQVNDTVLTTTTTLVDPTPADSVTFNDFGSPLNGLPTATAVSASGPAPETFNFAGKTNFVLDAAGGNDTVTVNNPTAPYAATALVLDGTNAANAPNTYNLQALGLATTVNGGGGNDTFNVHDAAGTLNGIVKPLVLNGQGGTNTLNATNDSNFTLSNTALVFARAINLNGIQVANLTGGPGNNTFDVTNWTGSGTMTGGGGRDTILAANDVNYSLSNTALGRSGRPTLGLANIQVASLTGGAGNTTFDVGGWTGTGTVNGGGGSDTLTSTKNADQTLTDAALTASDGLNLTLIGFGTATLANGPGSSNNFDVSGWTGTGGLTGGGGSDTVTASKNTDFTLVNNLLTTGDGMTLALSGVTTARLTGGPGNNLFDVTRWTGTGVLTGAGGSDTVTATKNADFTLSNTALTAGDGLNLALNGIGTANLTGGLGAHTFDVGGWTGTGSLNGGGGSDTLTATRDADFTLANASLTSPDGLNLALSGFGTALLTGGPGNNTFDVGGWTGKVTVTGGGGTDTVTATDNLDFTLTDAGLARAGLPTVGLVQIKAARLTGGPNSNTFNVDGWTGGGTLTGGGGSDTVTATKSADFFLSNSQLTSGDGMSLALSGIAAASLTATPGSHTFNVGTYTGVGTLNGAGGDDTVTATKDANFTLADNSLTSTDGMNLVLRSVGTAFLTGGQNNATFDVSNWTGAASLNGGTGSDTVVAGGNVDFTLSNAALMRTGFKTVGLTNIASARLTGGAGNHTFNVDGWTGAGTLIGGGGNDTVTATKNANFTLTNNALSTSDGMSLTLSGIGTALLTDTKGNHLIDVSGWTGPATLTGGGNDTISATKDTNFTLTNATLVTGDGMSVTLSGFTAADLTGGPGNNTFNVTGWTGTGVLTGGGGSDTVTAAKDVDFSLSNTALASSDGMNLALSAIGAANLTDGTGNHLFAIGVWSGTGTLTGGGGSDTVTVTKDFNITLTDGQLSSSDGTVLALSGIRTANLTGGPGNNLFDVTGWTGGGSLNGVSGTDTVVAGNNGDFTLTDASLARSGLPALALANVKDARLTSGTANNTFDVTGWTGGGTLTGGGGHDTVTATKSADFSLTNSLLASGDGMSLTLSGIGTADLTSPSGNHTFALGNWTGTGSLVGGGGSDTVTIARDTNFTLSTNFLATSDGMLMTLAGIGAASLTGGPGNNAFDLSGWKGTGTVAGGGGNDTVTVARDTSFTLGDTSLTTADGMSLVLSGIGAASLTGGPGNNLFAIGVWSGTGTLTGGGGADTITVTKDANFTLTDTALTGTGGLNLALSGIGTADLTGGPGNNLFDVTGWTGGGSLNGVSGTDTVVASNNVDFTLSNASLARSGRPTLTLINIEAARLTSGPGNHAFDVSAWTGTGTLTAGGGSDTVTAAKNADFSLSNAALTSSDNMSLALSGIGTANLSAATGNHTFDVSGWTGAGSLTGGSGSDTVTATKDANFTLSNSQLTSSDGMALALSGIGTANLAGGPSNNTFAVSGWTGAGSLDGKGGTNTLVLSNDTNFTLTNTTVTRSGLPPLILANLEAASLTGGPGNNLFDVGGWSGAVTVTGGGGSDTVAATRDSNFTLTNAALTSADGLAVVLNGIAAADLTGGPGNNTFDVTGWAGGGSLTGAGGNDTVVATKDANVTLSNADLVAGGGLNLALSGIGTANLTVGPGADTVTVSGWTGNGSVTGTGNDEAVAATKDANFSLSNTALTSSDNLSLALAGIGTANLTAGPGADTFTVSGWTGDGMLAGVKADTVVAAKNTNFSLGDAALDTGDGMTMALNGPGAAVLTGGPGNNTFDVGGWTGTGSLAGGGGSDTVVATHDTNFTLSNNALRAADGLSLALGAIGAARLTGGAGANNFDVSGWTGPGTLAGGGGSDTVTAAKDTNFTLTNAALTTGDGMTMALNGVGAADLTGGPGNNTFNVTGWTGGGSLAGGGGSDTVTAVKDADFSLSDTALTSSDGMSLGLSAVGTANLTGGPGNNTFAIGSWTGTGTLTGGGGSDTVTATKDASFALTNTSLASSDNMSLTLSGIGTANLTGGPGPNTFDVSGWTGTGSVTGVNNNDTLLAAKDTNFTLTNAALKTGDGMTMALNAVGAADLTGGPGNNLFDVSGWTGAGALAGGGGSDTVTATKNANFTLSNAALLAGDGLGLGLTGIATAILAGGGGNNAFDVSGWSGNGTLTGGGGIATVTATDNGDFALSNTTLVRTGRQPLALQGFAAAVLTGAGTFDVSGWTGGGLLNGGGGASRVVVNRDASFVLSDTAVSDSAGLTMALLHVPGAVLTGGPSGDTFTVSQWGGSATLDGGTGANSYAITFKGSGSGTVTVADPGTSGASRLSVNGTALGDAITVTPTQVTRGGETVDYGGVAGVTVHGGSGANAITADASPAAALNLVVDGGPSGSNTLSVVDVTGSGVVHGSVATGQADVHYQSGAESTIRFANIQSLQLSPGANSSYVQSLLIDVLGRAGPAGQVQPLLGLLGAPNGRVKVVRQLELSLAGREQTVNSWFQQYAGRPASPFELRRLAGQLRRQTEEQVLSRLLVPVFLSQGGGNRLAFLNLASQALFGQPLPPGGLPGVMHRLRTDGRPAALLAMLKTRAYRLRLVEAYVRRLMRVPAGQPLSPDLQALVNQLAASKKDQRSLRIALEASDQFFALG